MSAYSSHRRSSRSRRSADRRLFLCVLILCSALAVLFFGIRSVSAKTTRTVERTYASIEIQEGDTLWGLAERYGGSVPVSRQVYMEDVRRLNHLSDDALIAGANLVLPVYTVSR